MTQSDADWLDEAARYFEKRPTGGEDMAFWANVSNAERCRSIAAALRASSGVEELRVSLDGEKLRKAVDFMLGPSAEGEEFTDATLWVGYAENDEKQKVYGLHLSNSEYPEEGCLTLAELPSPLPTVEVTEGMVVGSRDAVLHEVASWHEGLADYQESLATRYLDSGHAIEAEPHATQAKVHRAAAEFVRALSQNKGE